MLLKNWSFKLWCWRRLLRVPWTTKRSNQLILRKSVWDSHWNDWCWSSSTLATWCEELTHWKRPWCCWKRPWCWERLKAGGEGDNRGWDGWMASLTRWTWIWASSGRWWWDREAWRVAAHDVTKSQTWLSDSPELLLGINSTVGLFCPNEV